MSEPRKLRVFLCHSSNDKPAVRELYQRLNAEGWIDPWLDEEKLLPGQDWDLEIEKAVEAADAVIVFLSNNSVSKEGYIQRELRFVLRIADSKPEGTVFVIPVRLDDCPMPRRLSMWQYVDYFPNSQIEKAYQRLFKSLKIRANLIGLVDEIKLENHQQKSTDYPDIYKYTEQSIQIGNWYRALEYLNVREEPAIEAKVIFTLMKGEVVEKVSATIDASWIQIKKGDKGLLGWCQGQYMALVGGPPPTTSTIPKKGTTPKPPQPTLILFVLIILAILGWILFWEISPKKTISTSSIIPGEPSSTLQSQVDNSTNSYLGASTPEFSQLTPIHPSTFTLEPFTPTSTRIIGSTQIVSKDYKTLIYKSVGLVLLSLVLSSLIVYMIWLQTFTLMGRLDFVNRDEFVEKKVTIGLKRGRRKIILKGKTIPIELRSDYSKIEVINFPPQGKIPNKISKIKVKLNNNLFLLTDGQKIVNHRWEITYTIGQPSKQKDYFLIWAIIVFVITITVIVGILFRIT